MEVPVAETNLLPQPKLTYYNVLREHPFTLINQERERFDKTRDLWLRSTTSRQAVSVNDLMVEYKLRFTE
jgi:hypothetical protein